MTGAGRSHKERQRERVNLPECRKELERGSLAEYHQTQNGVEKGGSGHEGYGEGGVTIPMAFPSKAGPRPCPVEECSGRAATRMTTRMNLWHCHVRETEVILEEVNLLHPRCPM